MSSEGDPRGQPSTTALSTVAVQGGDTQIVVAVLKCGDLVQVQLTEARPGLLEIGSNQHEAKKLLEGHEQLLAKLKRNEGGVWTLLEKADKTAEEKQGEEVVYDAMAQSLSKAWKTLVKHLEKRRSLLLLACQFYDRALEFATKLDEAEMFQHSGQRCSGSDCLCDLRQRLSSTRRGLLETSILMLNKGSELLDFLRVLVDEEALQSGGGVGSARSSCRKVEDLMELLQDRRRQVDQRMSQQFQDLEVTQAIRQWESQEQEVMHWFQENADMFLETNQLGSSLSENQELLREHKEAELKVKDWSLLVEQLLQKASELLASGSGAELEAVSEKNRNLRTTHERFWSLMMARQGYLYESNNFFTSANKAFEVLAAIESSIKSLKMQAVPLPELAEKHEELCRRAEDAATGALGKGQLILAKLTSDGGQVAVGVQRLMGYIGERVEGLRQQCQASRELTERRRYLLNSFDELEDKISGWIRNSNRVLTDSTEPGCCLSETEDVLNKHLEISTYMQRAVKESEATGRVMEEMRRLDSPQAAELCIRASVLREQLHALQRRVAGRMESLGPYTGFLRSAGEVEEQVKMLLECYNSRPETEEENDETGAPVKDIMDTRWQLFLQKFLSMQDQGNNFINSSTMVNETLSLNVRAAVSVVEKVMESLSVRKAELSDLWTSWQLRYSQMKSVKKQWKRFKDQLKKVTHELKCLDSVIAPAHKIDPGSDLQVDPGSDLQAVSKLQDDFSPTKSQFLQLNAEVEFLVKTAELLALKGIPMKEKNEKTGELLQVHQHVRDKIREHETLLSMAVKFLQLYEELEGLLKTEPVKEFSDVCQAKMQLSQLQEKQNHVQHLYKLATSLSADINSTIQCSPMLVTSVQDKMERLHCSTVSWAAQVSRYQESLLNSIHYCVFKEELTELRESFKDIKKKFNNLKFNYMKKSEKLRNLKAVKNQIQQIEIYIEKLQVLKQKLQAFTVKVPSSGEKHLIGCSPRELEDATNELQRQVGDFDRMVEEYKQNLDLNMKLQQAMEEYQFWCDEASSTIVRVGRYSSQCKTKGAISSLYKQFEKFILPTVPQQEERVRQITELAVRLHGAEEGKKYMEKTVNKHNEIVESIKELSSGLLDLEAKLQAESLKEQFTEENNRYDTTETPEGKETGHTPEIIGPGSAKDDPDTSKSESRNPQLAGAQSQMNYLPNKLHQEQHEVLSETRRYTQEAYMKTSTVQTITSQSTVERKEQTRTSSSHTHTVCISGLPTKRDNKVPPGQRDPSTLQKTKSPSQNTPPPSLPTLSEMSTAPGSSDVHREFPSGEKAPTALRVQHGRLRGASGPYTATHTIHIESKRETPLPAEEIFSRSAPDSGMPTDGDCHDHLTEESLSNDEYECASSDDISLPPLSETPESNLVQSENDLDDGYCLSSHSLHVNQYSRLSHCQHGEVPEGTPSQADACLHSGRFRAESSSFVPSPLTVPTPTLVSSTISSILKSGKLVPTLPVDGVTACHQTLYSMHESRTETQECVHEPVLAQNPTAQAGNMHAPPKPLTPEQEQKSRRPTAVREEIRRAGASRAVENLAATHGPDFFKHLSNATVMEGSPVTLEVEVTGFPEPSLTWFKNGQKVHSDTERVSLSCKEGKHVLFIERATETDSGHYVVSASNSAGAISSSSVLQVKAPGVTPHSLHGQKRRDLLAREKYRLQESVSASDDESHMLRLRNTDTVVKSPNDTCVFLKRCVETSDFGVCVCVTKSTERGESCPAQVILGDASLEPVEKPKQEPDGEDLVEPVSSPCTSKSARMDTVYRVGIPEPGTQE
ncbi:coiled-coil domain-containing protein 141 isoform X1 [Electrophorus electricus]|uniref:coiled-coil domain-containing protein 141 isoform X1 n=1 Tax=Electrophorus electricus TaxID=8005 RepID=UPI0015D0C8E7|nr:coiled-coil domain-containing protein 141 isoform X1 [Electrophorus electricus]